MCTWADHSPNESSEYRPLLSLMIADLPVDLLVALDVFLRERHVTRAARRLGITQGAASQKLARLRTYFNDAILVPGRPQLIPTPRAQSIAEPLSKALESLRAAVRVGAPFDPSTSTRRFVLLGSDLAEVYALPLLLDRLTKEAPHVTLSIERTDADFVDRLEKGSADAAFVPDFLIPESLRKRSLPPDKFVVLLRNDHPTLSRRRKAKNKRTLDLATYLELHHLLVAPRGLPGSIVDAALEKQGKTRKVMARIQHFVSAPQVVASTDLAVTCPSAVHRATANWFPIVALPPPLTLPADRVSLTWHERSHEDQGHVWLRGLIDGLLRSLTPLRTN